MPLGQLYFCLRRSWWTCGEITDERRLRTCKVRRPPPMNFSRFMKRALLQPLEGIRKSSSDCAT